MNRRDFIATGVASSISSSAMSQSEGWAASIEEQRGDASLPYETVTIDPKEIYLLVSKKRAVLEPRLKDFSKSIAQLGATYAGKNRQNDEKAISQMLAIFELPFKSEDGKFVPYCASGLSYLAALTYLQARGVPATLVSLRNALIEVDQYHFYPSPSVWDMYHVALGKRRWVDKSSAKAAPKPGWLVIYDFGKGADHVGLVLSGDSKALKTFECNTTSGKAGSQSNGGEIAYRDRDWTYVKGFVRTDLDLPV